jgi:hypothetical protein
VFQLTSRFPEPVSFVPESRNNSQRRRSHFPGSRRRRETQTWYESDRGSDKGVRSCGHSSASFTANIAGRAWSRCASIISLEFERHERSEAHCRAVYLCGTARCCCGLGHNGFAARKPGTRQASLCRATVKRDHLLVRMQRCGMLRAKREPICSFNPHLLAPNAAIRPSRRCRPTPASSSMTARAAANGSSRSRAIAACSALTAQCRARRHRATCVAACQSFIECSGAPHD